jgi:DNA-binding GntR family transcriptional regulator
MNELPLLPLGVIEKESLSEKAYREIRKALASSRLKSGQKLVLRPLAKQLGISATPVREALLRLASEGVLIFDERGTATVPEMTLTRYLEIRDIRIWLEGQAGLRATKYVADADIEKLSEIHQRMMKAELKRDSETALDCNGRFHFLVCSIARMPMLLQMVESLWVQCGPAMGQLYDEAPPRDPEGHQHICIIDGLRKRNGKEVQKAIERDIEVGGHRLLALLR